MSSDKKPAKITAEDEIAKGRFCNFAQVSHDGDSFMVDLAAMDTGETGRLVARIFLAPRIAKRLSMALAENIAIHEAAFGRVDP